MNEFCCFNSHSKYIYDVVLQFKSNTIRFIYVKSFASHSYKNKIKLKKSLV